MAKEFFRNYIHIPYARHYNPRFVFILPHFSLRFIFESGLYCREVSIYMNLFYLELPKKEQVSTTYLFYFLLLKKYYIRQKDVDLSALFKKNSPENTFHILPFIKDKVIICTITWVTIQLHKIVEWQVHYLLSLKNQIHGNDGNETYCE